MEEYKTDVEGIYADGLVPNGGDYLYKFQLTEEEFFSSKYNRKTLRISEDNNLYKYLNSTQIKRPFYISTYRDNQEYLKLIR
jgi:hypothetical protein